MWNIIVSDPETVSHQMQTDWTLFNQLESETLPPTLRLYTWSQPGQTCGYVQHDLSHPPSMVRRPTGGGIVFHDTTEVAYCLATPYHDRFPRRLMDGYYYVAHYIVEALHALGFPVSIKATPVLGLHRTSRLYCFDQTESHEITLNENIKVVGIAQRRTRKGILQQGTIKVSVLMEHANSS